ncbi:MAG: chloride channel protein [Bacteroidetes bacterium]|nr:MAG: chloride channel protein [Bacteroidota bacterium]
MSRTRKFISVVHHFAGNNLRMLVLILSLIIGLLSGLAAVMLKNIVHYTHSLVTNGFDFGEGRFVYLFFPVIGITITVLFAKYIIKADIGHGISNILYAISKKNGRIDKHNIYSSMIASTFTIAFGGSVGLEAPIVLTGSSIGSYFGRLFRLNQKTVIILIGAGASGAIAGIFKAPIAAVVFSLEVLMLDLTMASLIPLLISAAAAASVAYFLMGSGVLFSFHFTDDFLIANLPWYILLGLLTGFVSLYFTKTTLYIEKQIKSINKVWQRVLLGSFLVGVLIFIFPSLYGEGYEFLRELINGETQMVINESLFGKPHSASVILMLLTAIVFIKVIAMALTSGSGGVGGIFAPSLFVGGIFGGVFGELINLLPFVHIPVNATALVGMSGVMAGVMHAPLTGIFLIAEFTGGYSLFTPLIITATVSYLTIMYFEPHSIYTKRLAERGELLTHHKDKAVLMMMNVKSLIETNFNTIHLDATLGDLVKVISQSERNIIPVVDNDNTFYGLVFVNDIRNIIFKPELYDKVFVEEVMFMPDPIVSPDENMESVAQKFQNSRNYNLPVVDNGKYVGFVSRARVFSTYRKLLEEISDE